MTSPLITELPIWWLRAFAFVFGAIWGSFANVVIYRWPRELSVVSPGSHCTACGAPVRAFDNVPILSWLVLRGRCRSCGAGFSIRYATIELLFAVLSVAVLDRIVRAAEPMAMHVAFAHYAVRFCVVFVLVVATFIDLDEMLVPWWVKWFAIVPLASSVLLRPVPPAVGPADAFVGAALGYVGLRLLFIDGYKLLTGRPGMGLGDAELLLLVGALLGIRGVLFALGAGSVQGVVAVGLIKLFGGTMPGGASQTEPTESLGESANGDEPKVSPPNESEVASTPRERVEPATAREISASQRENDESVKPAREHQIHARRESTESGDAAATERAARATGGENDRTDGEHDEPNDDEDNASPEGRGLKTKVAFVPFLALGALEYLLGADRLIEAYLRLLAS